MVTISTRKPIPMTLAFVGTVSVADCGNAQIRAMFIAALGCMGTGFVGAIKARGG